MAAYIKSNTTYTLRKRSQGINGGAIYERDWSTLDGQKLRFGKGKTPLYNDGNFIFTTSNIQSPSKRNKASTVTVTYTYNDVKDSKSIVNNVELNENSNDIRSFAYYGSCVELVQKSITHIIEEFPASIYTTSQQLEYLIDENNIGYVNSKDGNILYLVKNPFAVDLISKSVVLSENDNKYRYMCETYEDYTINGEAISGFVVDYSFSDCHQDDQWYNFRDYYEKNDREAPVVITFYKNKDEVITKFIGFRYYNDIIFLCEDNNINIRPKDELIEKYFDGLKGFEKQLLNRKTQPLYFNSFITPVDSDYGYQYVKRNYQWPTINDYCIDIETVAYDDFVNKLLSMATIYDELWCNNLYNRMTHEAIKNFDWTYTQEYNDGEEQDNIDGGLRMQQILYFIGGVFDNTKQYIDGIKNNNKCTYDNLNNMPDALLSDRLELSGWDTLSVIPILKDNKDNGGYVKLDADFINKNKYKWYGANNTGIIDSATYDNQFMKRLLLNSKKILSSKGTQEAIDMIMGMFGFGRNNENGENDFDVFETVYKVKLNPNITREVIENINYSRTDTYFDGNGDGFLNLPLGELLYHEIEVSSNGITKYKKHHEEKRISHSFVIPFYEKDKEYLTDLYFHGKGGWGQMKEYKLFKEYLETISYLNVVSNVADLFKTDSMSVDANDIYYVVNMEDYAEYYDEPYENRSHFFFFSEGSLSTYFPSSWQNISFENPDDEYCKKAMYLNDLITTKFGNNPHCGFGHYDNGEEFKGYMSLPFKYLTESGLIAEELAKDIHFDITEVDEVKTLTESQYNEEYYYLNSKVVRIKNNLDNIFYKKYFKETMLPYLLQVIPSTTILILENF